jgi:hypothetical protein
MVINIAKPYDMGVEITYDVPHSAALKQTVVST